MIHKNSSVFGKAVCGASRVHLTRKWDKVTCPDCFARQSTFRKKLDYKDEEYIGGLQEKIDYDCGQDVAAEVEAAIEDASYDAPTPWERNQ